MNESRRRQLQDMIEEATSNNGNRTYLHILSQYRLLVSNPQRFRVSLQNVLTFLSSCLFALSSCLFAMNSSGDDQCGASNRDGYARSSNP